MESWLLLIIEIPIVVYLIYIIRKRIIILNERIDQIKREESDGPVDPYRALFDIMSPQFRGKITTRSKIKNTDVTEHRNGSSSNPEKKEDHG